jgi:hypothetical protein
MANERLRAIGLRAIAAATRAYLHSDRGSDALNDWDRGMRDALTQLHTTAGYMGLSKRSGQSLADLAGKPLPKADQAIVNTQIASQHAYLDGFVAAIAADELTDPQIARRAVLYAGAGQATMYQTQYADWSLPWVPGDGTSQCLGNCRCSVRLVDDHDGYGWYYWQLGPTELHCEDCPERADSSPVRVQRQ